MTSFQSPSGMSPLQCSRPGCMAQSPLPSSPFGHSGAPTYSEALRRGLDVYRDLLVSGPTVLLGDFNSSVAWDRQHGRTDHRELEAQLKYEFGLVSAYHAASGETARDGISTDPLLALAGGGSISLGLLLPPRGLGVWSHRGHRRQLRGVGGCERPPAARCRGVTANGGAGEQFTTWVTV